MKFGLRAAAVDDDLLESLQRLIIGDEPLTPADLPRIELALRALLMTEELHMVPLVAEVNSRIRHPDDRDDRSTPIGDGILDYEFVYEPDRTEIALLSDLSPDEITAIRELVSETLSKQIPEQHSSAKLNAMVRDTLPLRFTTAHIFADVPGPGESNDPESLTEAESLAQGFHSLRIDATRYALTLVRLHLGGGTIFSDSGVARITREYLFSLYPLKLLDSLDEEWEAFARTVIGPGIGAFVPPLLACVLSRVSGRAGISLAVRDLREEYTRSRRQLWDLLEELWVARTISKQAQIVAQLENASKNFFKSAFPERFPYLETAMNAAVEIGQLRPLSASKEVGKALLKHNEPVARVSAIGFAKQLSGDLRQVEGFSNLLRKILTRAERARFGIA